MCGLVGMAGYLEPHKHKAVMRDLLFLDTLRGRDSTGISCVSREKNVLTRKMTIPGYEFIEYPVVDKSMKFGDQLWMGHNRFKTTGEVNRANAHPFEVIDDEGYICLIGAHNGTLTNKYEIENELNRERFDTDSEALFNLFVKKNNFKDAVNLLKGAWSLTFWDPTTDSLHFLRNQDRPMSFAWSKDHRVLLWASEPWMLINAARRNGMDLDLNDKGLACHQTLPDYLYTFEIPQARDKAMPDFKREGGYTGAPVKNFQSGWVPQGGVFDDDNWWNDPNNPNSAVNQEAEKKAKSGAKENKADSPKAGEPKQTFTLGYPGNMRGFNGSDLSLAKFKQIKDKGCGWCKNKFEGDLGYAFLTEDVLVCGHCMKGTHPTSGDCVRPDIDYAEYIDPDEDAFDDPLPADLGPAQANSPEGRKLIAAAVEKAIG